MPANHIVDPTRRLSRANYGGQQRMEVWAMGDGNCLFHSVSYLLDQAHVHDGRSVQELRAAAVGVLRGWFGTVEAPGAFRDWLIANLVNYGEIPAEQADAARQVSVTAWLDRMAQDGTYGDLNCMAALEDLYDVYIQLYSRGGNHHGNVGWNNTGAHTLHIAYVSYRGFGSPNHYNPIIPDDNQPLYGQGYEGRVIPTELHAVDISSGDGARAYVPPIFHDDFEALPVVARGFMSSIALAFGSGSKVQTGYPLFDSLLLGHQQTMQVERDRKLVEEAVDISTPFYTRKSAQAKRGPFRATYTLPLAFKERVPSEDLDLRNNYLEIAIGGTFAENTAIELSVTARTAKRFRPRSLTMSVGTLRSMAAVKGPSDKDVEKVTRFRVPLTELDSSGTLFGKLGHAASPYRLSIWCDTAGAETNALCCYFNVPAVADVMALAETAATPVLMLGDFMAPLEKLKVGVVQLLSERKEGRPKLDGLRGESEKNSEGQVDYRIERALDGFMAPIIEDHKKKKSEEERDKPKKPDAPKKSGDSRMGEIHLDLPKDPQYGRLNTYKSSGSNTRSVLWRDSEDTWFLQTSWASFAVVKREKDGFYAHWLGTTPDARFLMIAEPDGDSARVEVPEFTFELSCPNYFNPKFKEEIWKVYDLSPRRFKLSNVVTTGISSCAGGVTWPAADPDYYIMWHFDAGLAVTVPFVAEMIWGKGKIPALRNLASVFPNTDEVRKYRPEMLYPEGAKCETVMMLRGSQLGSDTFATGGGHSEFGLRFGGKAGVELIGTYGFHKRAPTLPDLRRAADDFVERLLLDYNSNLFEDYHPEGKPIESANALKAYSLFQRTDSIEWVKGPKAQERFFLLVLDDLFAAALKAQRPLSEQNAVLIGVKGCLEINGHEGTFSPESRPVKKVEKSSVQSS